jgi:acyl-CoA reductase-like NAD-dependent aldehyde dehydrogenase
MNVQRATVLNWLLSTRVMASRDYCDRTALDRALAAAGHTLPTRGRPANARDRVLQKMLDDLRGGRRTVGELSKMKQQTLAADYGASRKVCNVARKMALSEATRL